MKLFSQAVILVALFTGTALSGPLPSSNSGKPSSDMVDRYLTAIAQRDWKNHAAAIAALRTPADVHARQRYIRAKMLDALGGFPEKRTPLNARITGTLERNGYRVEKLIYESLPQYYVTANVYVPTTGKGPFPAVLGTAGHSDSGKAIAIYQTAFIELAKRGFVVLAYDPPDQGERKEYLGPATPKKLTALITSQHTMSGLQCVLTGGNIARYELWDGIRGVDYLLTRNDVDPKRIAIAGNSGGGTQSAYMAVVEPRLAAAVPSCYISSWKAAWLDPGPQDAEQDLTNFLKDGLDFSDFLIAFAPKPIEMLTATKDFFPIAGARASYAEAHHVFSILGKADRVGYFEYDDHHGWSKPRREATYAWLEKWLQGRTKSAPEGNVVTEPVQNLNCTRTGQVATSLGGKTVQILNQEVAEKLYAHRRALNIKGQPALRGLITARLEITLPQTKPNAQVVGRHSRDGYQLETVNIESEPGIILPTLVFIPQKPDAQRTTLIAVNEAGKAADAGPGGKLETLARRGYLVIAPDLRGLGESCPPQQGNSGYTGRFQTDMRALLVGKTMTGMRVYDLLQVFNYATTRPDVNASHIAILGKGTPATAALYAASLQPRIQKVVLQDAIPSYMDIVRAKFYRDGLMDLIVPGVLHDFDLPDIARSLSSEKVVIVNPQTPNGSAASPEKVAQQYGPSIRIQTNAVY